MSESFPVRQAADRVPKRAIIIVAVAGVVITVLASLVPAWMLERRALLWLDAPTRASHTPVAPSEINIIDQTLIENDEANAWVVRDRQRRMLDRYGWVDRARGIAHIPIDVAMQLSLQKHASDTPPAPSTGTDEPGSSGMGEARHE